MRLVSVPLRRLFSLHLLIQCAQGAVFGDVFEEHAPGGFILQPGGLLLQNGVRLNQNVAPARVILRQERARAGGIRLRHMGEMNTPQPMDAVGE